MATRKLFIGRKVRELREANKATQASFAERIGISTSYLNQIENNQRPVSAAVLLALADKFRLNIAELSVGENDRLLSALSEALTDPLFETYSPSLQELKLITQNAPGLAHALIACHEAYRRNSERLASFDATLGRAGDNMIDAIGERGGDLLEQMTRTGDDVARTLDNASDKMTSNIDVKSDHLSAQIADLTR